MLLKSLIQFILTVAPDIVRIYQESKSEREKALKLEAMLKRKLQEEIHDRRVSSRK